MRVKKSLSIVLSLLLLISAMYVPLAFTAYADPSDFVAQHMKVDFDGYDAANTYEIYEGEDSTDFTTMWDGAPPKLYNGSSVVYEDFKYSWAGGSGTETDPYRISTAAQLAKLAWLCTQVGGSSFNEWWATVTHDKYWVLTNDIVLNDTTDTEGTVWYNKEGLNQWYATTSTYYSFNGHFDGQGHTIKGLYINSANSGAYAGLFANLGADAVVENLKISNSYIKATYAAAVTGGVNNTVTFANLAPIVRSCYIDDSVKIEATNAAGIRAYGDRPIKIENCYVGAEIKGTDKSGSFIGGTWGNNGSNTVEYSYSSSAIAPFGHQNVTGINSYVNSANNAGFKRFDPAAATGEGAKTQMPNLDYANTWVTLPGSKPQLRVFCNKDAYQPCSVETSETDANDKYMKIEKQESTFTAGGEEYRVGFMLNKTGAADAQVYELKAGGRYRVALKYTATEGVKVAAYSANSASETKMRSLGSQDLLVTETNCSFDFTVPGDLDVSGVNALYLAFETTNNYDGTTSFAVNVTDVVVDRLGTITVNKEDGTKDYYYGVPACNVADAPYSVCAAEVLNLPKSGSEVYGYKTNSDDNDATAKAYGLAYYSDADKTEEITEPITFTAGDKTVYAGTKTVVDTTYQMAFTGFEDDVYKERRPNKYYKGDANGNSWYEMPTVLYRGVTDSGMEITQEDAYTGSSSIKYDPSKITNKIDNHRAIYIGNRFEFTPERTYAISFYVKAAEGSNTASSVKFAVRGGVSCSEWGDRNNNAESADVTLTKDWKQVTINYKPNKPTKLGDGITNENAYYVPQLCVDYGKLKGEYTEGAKFYIDTLSIDVIQGDCNGDGERDILDLVRIKKISLDPTNSMECVAEELKAANFDSATEGVDAQDVTAFKKGILSNFQ